MRILFLSREYPPETGGGGIGTYVACVAPALAALRHEVHVLSCVPGLGCRDYFDGEVWIHRRDQVRIRGLARVLRSGSAAARIRGALSCWREARRLGSFDVVEAPDWMAEGLVFAHLRSRPLVAHVHSPLHAIRRHNALPLDWDARLGDLLERVAVRRADLVTSPSLLLSRDLKRSGWLGARAAQVVRNPVDLARWADVEPADTAPPTILVVGRLESLKAPELVVDAVARLGRSIPGVEVVFVGRSVSMREGVSYREWLGRRADSLGVRCRFIEHVPRQQLVESYGQARVVVQASRYENFGFAALEAMAAARPVICSDRNGVAEILAGSGGGAVVPAGDPTALAAALLPYLENPELAAEAGRRAREVVAEHCGPDMVARQREAIYRRAAEAWSVRRAERTSGLPNAAPRLRVLAPEWHRWAVRETAVTPWKHFYLRTAEQLLELLRKSRVLPDAETLSGVKVLDLACTPHVSMALACLGAGVWLVDVSREELRKAAGIARELGVRNRIKLILADAFHPPFRHGVFDLVWNSGFVEHFENPGAIVATMASLARRDGAVCVLTPAPLTPHSLFIRERLRRRADGYYWDRIGRERSLGTRDLQRLLMMAGLRPVASATANLRRSLLDDAVVLPWLGRWTTRWMLWPAVNLVDWIERRIPGLKPFGFMAGVVGIRPDGDAADSGAEEVMAVLAAGSRQAHWAALSAEAGDP